MTRRRLLHVIHDFLPRHAAGSEIYALELALSQRRAGHAVWVLTADYDPASPHGSVRWREVDGLPIAEIVNNWAFATFEESYDSARINGQIARVLDVLQPDVVHVHNLLNLSLSLPRLARDAGARVAATLHDYTLMCPSGGQRIHRAENHRCDRIDPARCARCFAASAYASQMAGGVIAASPAGRLAGRAAAAARRLTPLTLTALAQRLPRPPISPESLSRRLDRARAAYAEIDLVVAPSAALADEFRALGFATPRCEVADYGFCLPPGLERHRRVGQPLRIGYVGSIVWHKGVHVLIEAAARLRGRFDVQIAGSLEVAPDYVAALRRRAATLAVRFSGAFARSDVARLYAGLDVLVVPSIWLENSPLVIHEAFAYGVAVVASRIGGIPGLVTDAADGLLFEPGSSGALAACLQRLIDEPALAARLAAAVPAIRTIEEDAADWEARYASLPVGGRRPR